MEFLNYTLGDWIDKIAAEYPDNLAVAYTDKYDYRRTYKEYVAECDKIARSFLALGVKRGDHIAIWSTNTPQWILTLFAAAKIGAVLVTVNTAYKIHEAEYLLKQSDTNFLVTSEGFKDSNYIDILNRLCPEISEPGCDRANLKCARLPELRAIITIDDIQRPGMFRWSELYELTESVTDEEYEEARKGISPHDVVNMQYTSGTTGFPKGVMLTHYNILNNGKTIGDRMKFTPADKLCIPVPFFHCFGLVLSILVCVTHAAAMVPLDHYNPVKVMEAVDREQCTALNGVPKMFIGLLELPNFKDYKLNLRTGIMAGSPCPIKLMRQAIDELGMREITIVYGQTEASPGCTQTLADDPIEVRVNTVGRAFPGVEIKIIDPATGETLRPNQNGELCARGYNIMKGYYKMPEATAQAIDADGWLHTGDIACVDENGNYKITGRIKDMIIRGGENIFPKEIEDFLYTHPAVSDVQVIGVPDRDYGEEIMACIILKEGAVCTEDEIKKYVADSMARHKVPRYVWFMDEFPINAANKILKYKMREMAIERLSLQDAASIETA